MHYTNDLSRQPPRAGLDPSLEISQRSPDLCRMPSAFYTILYTETGPPDGIASFRLDIYEKAGP